MRLVFTCQKCLRETKSPEGGDSVTFTEVLALIKKMVLKCRVCGGEVVVSEEGR